MGNKFYNITLILGAGIFGIGLDFNSMGFMFAGIAAGAVGFFGSITD